MHRLSLSVLLLVFLVTAATQTNAQTIRFQTTIGAFDMLLNPTNDANLQPLVDNMLANVAAGVYRNSVVNRAPEGFVLQLGGFVSDSRSLDDVPQFGFAGANTFDPVVVDADNDGLPDFDTSTLNNSRGTVSLALSAGNANSGTSSFFVNIGDNSGSLDPQGFVPFAEISDMATIDRIMAQNQIDLSNSVGQPGSLAYIDVPLTDDGDLILIESAVVVSQSNFSFVGPLLNAFDIPLQGNASATSSSVSATDEITMPATATAPAILPTDPAVATSTSAAVPEPTAFLLAALALLGAPARRR